MCYEGVRPQGAVLRNDSQVSTRSQGIYTRAVIRACNTNARSSHSRVHDVVSRKSVVERYFVHVNLNGYLDHTLGACCFRLGLMDVSHASTARPSSVLRGELQHDVLVRDVQSGNPRMSTQNTFVNDGVVGCSKHTLQTKRQSSSKAWK